MVRSPAVAGQFYPKHPAALTQTLDQLIPATDGGLTACGVMVPHAGYVYSGAVAGRTFAAVAVPEEVVILGPNHHGAGHQAAVYRHGAWDTPLGRVPIAEALADAVLAACPAMAADIQAHLYEHSLEVQVPFLQVRRSSVSILPLCIGRVPLDVLLEIGDGLAKALLTRAHRPLLVASTDMTHYESGETARRKDHQALDRVLALDPEGLYRTVRDQRISMCGVLPTVVMLRAALALGATRAELVAYANSGDVTGDQREVVGYAGVTVS
ncbi:MAG: AmmeMemoRadiSam system protein B [Deltaproteobacteria bacterium]|nr:MAG: AmmeMemoRadiSam system protein B [Deltaproteobacteria bacterium]